MKGHETADEMLEKFRMEKEKNDRGFLAKPDPTILSHFINTATLQVLR
jgi:hypothetical protein